MTVNIIIICLTIFLLGLCAFYFTGSDPTNYQLYLRYLQNKRREKDYFALPENELEKYKQFIKDTSNKI